MDLHKIDLSTTRALFTGQDPLRYRLRGRSPLQAPSPGTSALRTELCQNLKVVLPILNFTYSLSRVPF